MLSSSHPKITDLAIPGASPRPTRPGSTPQNCETREMRCSGSFGRPRMVRAGAATCWSLDDCRSTFYVAVRNVSLDGEFDRVVLDGGPERGGDNIGDAREECFVGEIDVRRQG
jgi:hypothetical protein